MTFAPHALLKFGGRLGDTEEWSNGIRIITDDGSATVQNWVDALEPSEPGGVPLMLETFAGYVEDWFLRAGSQITSLARLDYVSLNAIGPDGKYADGGNPHTVEYSAGAAPTGPVQGTFIYQLSVCVSWRSAQARGRATKGRIYPPTVLAPTAAGRVGESTRVGMAESARDLLEDIATYEEIILPGNPRAAIVSDLGAPGPARIITRVLVGDVYDTQRRRREDLAETYTSVDVVT